MSYRILIVEDEPGLVMTLKTRLLSENYIVETAMDGNTGLLQAKSKSFDLIILDVMLPHRSGFDICQELRQAKIRTPILMLTARSQVVDKVLGLKLGADDYLTKPFTMMELVARVEALIRRDKQHHTVKTKEQFVSEGLVIDFESGIVTLDDTPINLSAREFQLLSYFIEKRGKIISRDELLNEVWGYDAIPSTRTVDVHVASLRQKIEINVQAPQFILTVHGRGYRFMG